MRANQSPLTLLSVGGCLLLLGMGSDNRIAALYFFAATLPSIFYLQLLPHNNNRFVWFLSSVSCAYSAVALSPSTSVYNATHAYCWLSSYHRCSCTLPQASTIQRWSCP